MKASAALEQFLTAMEACRAQATVAWYRSLLTGMVRAVGDRSISKISLSELRAWRAQVARRTQSVWTNHSCVRCCRRFFGWLVEEELLAVSPAERLELPALEVQAQPGIDRADMARMLAAAQESGRRDYALLRFIADTGCRRGGAASLRLCDLDIDSRTALVIEKGNKRRPVWFGETTAAALRVYLLERSDSAQAVFLGPGGRPLGVSGIYHVFERIAKKAGVKQHWSPHQWRHGAARGMLKRGANLAQVSQILGHRDVRITCTYYGAFADRELKAAHGRYSWLSDA